MATATEATTAVHIESPILRAMVARHGIAVLDQTNLDDFLGQNPMAVLFFAEDPKRYPESADVAMVLPELVRAIPELTAGLVGEQDQLALQQRYPFTTWPTLAFFKEGNYRGAISHIQNWQDYLEQINELYSDDTLPTIPVVNL
ncbi:hypothetical protein [Halioxenophilus sp. WMMB6]|uniref:hypothetical protein n=1 Tax=Halioxenophilus sp. WMMB6 TaxID=3073815 RepID=UPI00295EB143|nr:hypothetical protein [Halioxenophilus sp. WMMB6]